jgi:inhibitor of KinA sporulation pathway (predicted exonuclease)
MEIIEIGTVMQSPRTFEVESEFQPFVRPVRRPELTEFCKVLITQNVMSAPPSREALEAMKEWMDPFGDSRFCSWGEYDRKKFHKDCQFHRIASRFPLRTLEPQG